MIIITDSNSGRTINNVFIIPFPFVFKFEKREQFCLDYIPPMDTKETQLFTKNVPLSYLM